MGDVKEPKVRQEEIMDAALQLFIKKGYMNTTTQDIIEAVKISRGLLYYHFKNKEDILYRLVEKYSASTLRRLSAITYDEEKSAVEKIRLFVEATIIQPESITPEILELQKTVDLDQNRYLMDRFSHKLTGRLTTYFAHILEQGIREGEFHLSQPYETAVFLMTGYVFVSMELKAPQSNFTALQEYMTAFKKMLHQILLPKTPLFNDEW